MFVFASLAAPLAVPTASLRPIYDFDRMESFEDYKTRELTVATIRADIARFREWEREVEKMRVQYTVGCLYVDSKRLKAELGPITTNALESIKGLLKDVAREKCKEVYTLLAARTKTLGTRRRTFVLWRAVLVLVLVLMSISYLRRLLFGICTHDCCCVVSCRGMSQTCDRST